MPEHPVHAHLPGQLVILGSGSIGQAVLPLILRHLGVTPEQIVIVTADARGREAAAHYGIEFVERALTPENYRADSGAAARRRRLPAQPLGRRQLASALIRLARERGALYLDTCIEPWAGAYFDTASHPEPALELRAARERARRQARARAGPTAVIAQGANPGLVSQLLKEAAA